MDCVVCKKPVPPNRNVSRYCSKKCQASIEGYTRHYSLKLLKQKLLGTTLSLFQDKPDKITSPKVGLLFDIHVPHHSEFWLNRAIETFWMFGIKQIVIGGDLLDCSTISQKHSGNYYRSKHDLESELQMAEKLLTILSESFENILILPGNHDMRVVQQMGGEISLGTFMRVLGAHKNVRVSSYSYCYINEKIVAGHPRQYSRIRGNLAQKISQLWQKTIVVGHEHHSSSTQSPDGRHQAIACGCIAEIEKLQYNIKEINDMPRMSNGFAVVIGNKVQLFDKFTPWELFGLEDK